MRWSGTSSFGPSRPPSLPPSLLIGDFICLTIKAYIVKSCCCCCCCYRY